MNVRQQLLLKMLFERGPMHESAIVKAAIDEEIAQSDRTIKTDLDELETQGLVETLGGGRGRKKLYKLSQAGLTYVFSMLYSNIREHIQSDAAVVDGLLLAYLSPSEVKLYEAIIKRFRLDPLSVSALLSYAVKSTLRGLWELVNSDRFRHGFVQDVVISFRAFPDGQVVVSPDPYERPVGQSWVWETENFIKQLQSNPKMLEAAVQNYVFFKSLIEKALLVISESMAKTDEKFSAETFDFVTYVKAKLNELKTLLEKAVEKFGVSVQKEASSVNNAS